MQASAHDLNQLRDLGFRLEKLDEHGSLSVLASFDFTMYVQFRVTFTGVVYINLPIGWNLRHDEFEEYDPPMDFVREYGSLPLRALRVWLDGREFNIYFKGLEIEKLL